MDVSRVWRSCQGATTASPSSTITQHIPGFWQSVGAARPSDLDEHVAAAKLYEKADDLVQPVVKTMRYEARAWCMCSTHVLAVCRTLFWGRSRTDPVAALLLVRETVQSWVYEAARKSIVVLTACGYR